MATLNQLHFQQAQKRLYILGHRDARRDQTSFEDGEAVGAGIGAPAVSAAIANLKNKTPQQGMPAYGSGEGTFVARRGKLAGKSAFDLERTPEAQFQVDLANENPQYHSFPNVDVVGVAKQAKQQMDNNDLADQTRMGGVYSPNGLVEAQKNAQANADDRLRMRAMIGIGGSLRSY